MGKLDVMRYALNMMPQFSSNTIFLLQADFFCITARKSQASDEETNQFKIQLLEGQDDHGSITLQDGML